MTRHWRRGAPWCAQEALEIIGVLDMAAWAAVASLVAEFPVALANVIRAGDAPVLSVDPAAYTVIASNAEIAAVHQFLQRLPGLLGGCAP
jgi:hypothetical protein